MKETEQLIKELWSLWDSMAECGELSIGPKFSAQYADLKARVEQHLNKYNVSGSFLCDGCNVREPYEHRCHGAECKCDNPICMEQQGRITHEQLMDTVNGALGEK